MLTAISMIFKHRAPHQKAPVKRILIASDVLSTFLRLQLSESICSLLHVNNNLNRSIIFQRSSSHNKDFGIMVTGRRSLLCKGEEGVTVPQIKESRNSVCNPTWLFFKQSCFDRFLAAATLWWCVSHGGLEFLWIENVPNVWQVLACFLFFGLVITIFQAQTRSNSSHSSSSSSHLIALLQITSNVYCAYIT